MRVIEISGMNFLKKNVNTRKVLDATMTSLIAHGIDTDVNQSD